MTLSLTLKPLLPHAHALALRAAFCSLLLLCAPPAALAAGRASVETVDGRKLESLVIRNPAAQATVVFENGSRATLAGWDKVLEAVSPDATVFAYNRPGYGLSEATGTPRDGATIVDELRSTLRQKGLAPPYVLVGHSLGGLYPKAKTVVADASHQMQATHPEIVSAAIREILTTLAQPVAGVSPSHHPINK